MIIVDIECSGLDSEKCGIIEIGAIELENPENVFREEARIDDEDEVEDGALRILGKTEADLRDRSKQTQRELLEHFLSWASFISVKTCICQNPQFDLAFIGIKLRKYGIENILPHRAFDLHSFASLKYFIINHEFLIEQGKSAMGLKNVLALCGMEDKRKFHNALEDARLTAECFSRVVFGKNLLNEYYLCPVPIHLTHGVAGEMHGEKI